jgi:Flp pilus assembly protein TadG
MLYRQNHKRKTRRGAATVELAVLLPVLAFLFVIGVDWSRIFFVTMTIENAARNGAYYASEYPGVTDKMVYGYPNVYDAAADDVEIPLGLSNMGMYYGTPSTNSYGTSISSTGATAVPDTTDQYGTNVKVITVTFPFSMISNFPIPVPGVSTSVTLSRSVTMRTAPVLPN